MTDNIAILKGYTEQYVAEYDEDVILWPCGDWCYRYELEEMQHKSDDYQVLKYGSKEHEAITLV